MTVARARYTGRPTSHVRRVPATGERYTFRRYPNGDSERAWQDIDSVEDAKYLDDQPNIEVEWTPMGKLKRAGDDAVAAVTELGYNTKQKLVGSDGFGLETPANASDEELEQALQDHVEALNREGEL